MRGVHVDDPHIRAAGDAGALVAFAASTVARDVLDLGELHADVSRAWRGGIATLAFDDRDAQVLLAAVREGMTVAEAAAAISVSHQQVYGRARWGDAFRETLEDALAQTCPAGQYCGTPTGVRHHGGRDGHDDRRLAALSCPGGRG
ncbi:hypothetical protein [Nocardia farcinica]|uniref:hypothetical protein n=1 Tax=Nocardia farcinica TaxID=37329 RepID=UPI0024551157|nr:hypothetical protein [Nocardia farcinica]